MLAEVDPILDVSMFQDADLLDMLERGIQRRQHLILASQELVARMLALRDGLRNTLQQTTAMNRSLALPEHDRRDTPPGNAAAAVERLAAELDPDGKGLHINVLVTELHRRGWSRTRSARNLAKILNRWVKKGRRFRRVGPNLFVVVPPEPIEVRPTKRVGSKRSLASTT